MGKSFNERAKERRATMTGRVDRSPQEIAALERAREDALLPFERAQAIWSIDLIDLLRALNAEGAKYPRTFFIMGRAPNQIDIITTIDGVTFERAWKNRFATT